MQSIERHPFEPFLPEGAKVLMLGSFPPQRKRWCMEFYYPNWLNDFWRICGLVFYSDREHFVIPGQKRFDLPKIISFCTEKGIALYDTATEVRRLQDNASDKFLEIVTPTDLPALLARIPSCHTIVTTGQKATETILSACSSGSIPPVGGCTGIVIGGRPMDFYRMPSTSRAYTLSLDKKADAYRRLFTSLGLL